MSKRMRIELRVSSEEYKRWKLQAGAKGLSEWVRGCCNGSLPIRGSKSLSREAIPGRCAHGTLLGTYCGFCYGPAKGR